MVALIKAMMTPGIMYLSDIFSLGSLQRYYDTLKANQYLHALPM